MPRRTCRPCSRPFTEKEARRYARKVGIDLRATPLSEVVAGFNEEREHGDLTCCDGRMTALIVKRHLTEHADYYARLRKAME